MKTINNLISCSTSSFFLYSCSPANILGTGAGSAMVIAEEIAAWAQ